MSEVVVLALGKQRVTDFTWQLFPWAEFHCTAQDREVQCEYSLAELLGCKRGGNLTVERSGQSSRPSDRRQARGVSNTA